MTEQVSKRKMIVEAGRGTRGLSADHAKFLEGVIDAYTALVAVVEGDKGLFRFQYSFTNK